jgi:protein-disulfide isomerase
MYRFKQIALIISAMTFATASFAADTNNNISASEREKIETVVHDYLLRKPEVIVEVMQVLQRKQFDQAEQTVKQTKQSASSFAKELFHQANDPVVGNANGKITVVEFFDYQCGHCIEMAPVITEILKSNPDVRVVYKEFPIRGPVSEFASRAALAANKQGKYKEFSHTILTAGKPLTTEFILDSAKNVGLDVNKLKKDMDDKSIKDQVQANIELAKNLKLFGTPAFFVGKSDATNKDNVDYVPGRVDQAQMQAAIDKVK